MGDDMGDGMQCSEHPYRNNPGGICAFCLQEKLGKLVSSSKSNPFYPIVAAAAVAGPSSSSPSPSFRSEGPGEGNGGRIRTVAFLGHKQKKIMSSVPPPVGSLVLKRSRSVAVPRHFNDGADDTPRKKSFWSFLRRRAGRERESCMKEKGAAAAGGGSETIRSTSEEGLESPSSTSSFGRKVARSRSVGCGSRSFSGDFLERISTGLGDCTLRRVESQREAKPKIVLHRVAAEERIKERVKCGGIFAGFGISSSYLLSDDFNGGRISGPNSRSKSWGWAFASPMRAFRPSKPSPCISDKTKAGKPIPTAAIAAAAAAAAGGVKTNLSASASLLAVRG